MLNCLTNGLKPGSKYLMNDFQTVHYIPKTTVENTANNSGIPIVVEPLVLTASSLNTFEPIVTSLLFPTDIIYYNIDSALWQTLQAPNSKGIILRRINIIKDIDTSFDHKAGGMIFRRWAFDRAPQNGKGIIYCLTGPTMGCGQIWGGGNETLVGVDPGDYQDFEPFNFNFEVKNVKIGVSAWGINKANVNTVFKNNAFNINIGTTNDAHFESSTRNVTVTEMLQVLATEAMNLKTDLSGTFVKTFFCCF